MKSGAWYGSEIARAAKRVDLYLIVGRKELAVFAPGGNVEHFSQDAGHNAVDYVAGEGRKLGIVVKPALVTDSPANEIIRSSGNHDLIVMGTNGRTGLEYL